MKFRPKAVEAIQFTEPNRYGVMCNAWGEPFRQFCNFKDGHPDVLLLKSYADDDNPFEVQLGEWIAFQGLSWWRLTDTQFKALYEPVPLKKVKA